jgi:hypothetical protein
MMSPAGRRALERNHQWAMWPHQCDCGTCPRKRKRRFKITFWRRS